MIEPLIEECRTYVASIVVRRGNAILRERLREDSDRGAAAMNRCLRLFSIYPRLQAEIAKRILYRPPSFVLMRDNRLRQAAPKLFAALFKVRQKIADQYDKAELLAEIDAALDEAKEG